MTALIAEGKVAGLKGGRGAAKAVKEKPIVVRKRGSIVIPAEKVADLGVGKDDEFTIKKTRAGIALKRV